MFLFCSSSPAVAALFMWSPPSLTVCKMGHLARAILGSLPCPKQLDSACLTGQISFLFGVGKGGWQLCAATGDILSICPMWSQQVSKSPVKIPGLNLSPVSGLSRPRSSSCSRRSIRNPGSEECPAPSALENFFTQYSVNQPGLECPSGGVPGKMPVLGQLNSLS